MKKTQLILVSLFALAVFTCTSGVASAISISPKYVGNTMVDLSWTQYESTDFSKYELCRDGVPITTITDRTVTFYRDKGLTKGNTYGYGISVYDATGVLKATRTTSATTGEVHGTIIIDTTWTAASSPYTLTGSVDVRNGATLTIGSGVVVVSATYKAISVEEKGVLYADGASFYDVWIEVHDYTSIKNCFFEHARIKLHNLNNSIIAGNTVNRSGIKLYSSSNNVIAGNTVNRSGIKLYSSSNNVITDNTLSNNPYGIYLSSSSNNNITYNTISNSNMHGIYLGYSSNNNVITDNTISNNSDCGIYLYSSSNNVITDNTLLNNNYGIYLRSSSNNNVITDNTISNNDNNGIHLWYSSNNAITDNIVLNNDGDGIHLCGSYYNNSITDNTVSNNDGNGIHLCGSYYSVSNNNSITDNTVSNNSVGIRLSKSSNNTVTDNTVSNNSRYGIYMTKSSNNTLYNNYFNNPRNGYEYANGNNTLNITKTAGTNIVGGPYLGGNYWSNYKGTDLDSDGLGDTPYGVSFNRNWRDYHPLIEMPMEIEKIITLIASTEELPANGMNKSLITAIVTDQTGPVVGVKVSFSLDNTSLGKLEPLTAKTNESGIATSNFTAGTIPGVVNVTANESKTHASDSVKIILGMIKINHTSSTYQFIPTPCRNATINFEIKPVLLRDSPKMNISMIIKDKNSKLVYNSSEDPNARINNTTAIWTGKNTTGERVDPRLSNYTVKIIVKYRNMTVNDTHNVTILPNKVIVVVDGERMKALYDDAKVDKLMANLTDYCCRNNGTLYNLTKVRHDFNGDPGCNDAFTYRQLHQWLHYPKFVERRLENVTKFMIQNNNVSILLVGNDNVTPYHRMSAILPHIWGGVECGVEGGYSYVPGNILWTDFPYSEITGNNMLDVPVTRLEGNPEVMMVQLESTKVQYRGTKALLAIKLGRPSTRINHRALRNNLINGWGFGANVSYYNETRVPTVSIADKMIGGLSYLDIFDDGNVLMYAAAHGNDYKEPGKNVQRLSDDTHKIFLYPNNVSLWASHPLFVTKACHGACTYPGDTNTTSIPTALLADGAVGFVGWRAYGPTIQGADFFSNYYFPRLRVKNKVGDALMKAKNGYLVVNGNNDMARFIARAANHYGIPDYIVHVPNDPSDKGYSLTIDTFDDTTTIDMELFSYAQSTVETEQGNRTLFTISGAYVLDNEGDYVIPVIVEIIATLPSTLDIEQLLSITKSDVETITDIELPVAVWLVEKDDRPYDYSGESLNLPGLYPSEVIDYEVIEKVDGKRTVYFRIFPFQYNDDANEMYVYRNITFGFVTGPAKPKPPVRLSVTNDFESEITAGASTVVGMFIDNYGTGAAKNVNITEEIPGGFNVTFVSNGGTFNTATNIITWEIESIGSEDFKMLNYELVAPQTAGNYTVNTTIEYTDENGTVYPVINTSKFIIVSGAALPDLTLTSEDIQFTPPPSSSRSPSSSEQTTLTKDIYKAKTAANSLENAKSVQQYKEIILGGVMSSLDTPGFMIESLAYPSIVDPDQTFQVTVDTNYSFGTTTDVYAGIWDYDPWEHIAETPDNETLFGTGSKSYTFSSTAPVSGMMNLSADVGYWDDYYGWILSDYIDFEINIVEEPDFTIAAIPASQTVSQGDPAPYTISLTSLNGFNSPVTLTVSGLPTGAMSIFNPNPVTSSDSATLTINTSMTTPTGNYTLTITGAGGEITHQTTVALNITVTGEENVTTISATIHNIGTANASNVTVQFFDGDPDAGGIQIGGDQTITSISAGGAETVSVDWTPEACTYAIYVLVDPSDSIQESNEENNIAFNVILLGTRGDLNSDGKITPADALICLQIAAGSRPCDAATFAAADVSRDGQVTSLDALMILQAAAGAIEL